MIDSVGEKLNLIYSPNEKQDKDDIGLELESRRFLDFVE
jgi:hypothetical protein